MDLLLFKVTKLKGYLFNLKLFKKITLQKFEMQRILCQKDWMQQNRKLNQSISIT
jgi:hypothetical protein